MLYVCKECGQTSPKKMGKCFRCGKWDAFVLENNDLKTKKVINTNKTLTKISHTNAEKVKEFSTNINEMDRVLGRGMVGGSTILIGGEPGIGKSTLSLQIAGNFNHSKVLYIAGEESPSQIKARADRIGIESDNLYLYNGNDVASIKTQIDEVEPGLVIIDSIHTIESTDTDSSPGSISQLRNCSQFLSELAKAKNFILILVAHITKEGVIAGPKTLEHLVDTVLYFEQVDTNNLRILRTTKNRFGTTNEIGIFEMTEKGLVASEDPTRVFLSSRNTTNPGSAITTSFEGSRPILVEIQSLVSNPLQSFGKRYSSGIENNKCSLMVAIIEKFLSKKLSDKDIFLNVSKGLKIKDSSTDLAIIASIISSIDNKIIKKDCAFLGEIGLSGEVKNINKLDKRLSELDRLGFSLCYLSLDSKKDVSKIKFDQLRCEYISDIRDLDRII